MPIDFQEPSLYKNPQEFSQTMLYEAWEKGLSRTVLLTLHPSRDIKQARKFLHSHDMHIVLLIERDAIHDLRDLDDFIDARYELQLGDSRLLQSINFRHHESMQVPIESSMPAQQDWKRTLDQEDESSALADYIVQFPSSFSALLQALAENKGISLQGICKRSNLDRKAVMELYYGKRKKPSKSQLYALGAALRLSLYELQALLEKYGFSMSASSMQDLILNFFFAQKSYQIDAINLALYKKQQKILR